MISLANRFLDLCDVAATIIANLLLTIMLVVGLANLLIREVWGQGIIWVFPWTMVLFVWMVFTGYFVVFRRQSDIIVKIVVLQFGRLGQAFCRVLYCICTLGLNAVIISQIPRILVLKRDTVEIVGIPDYAVTMPLFISSGLVMLCALTLLFQPSERSHQTSLKG